MTGPRVVVLGLDGGTLDVIQPWAAAGLLPNLNALIRRGATGSLRSTTPPITPLAWPSIFTGLNPGKHGIVGFEHRVTGEYRWKKTSALDLLRPTLWELLAAEDIRSGIFFVPYTFPAAPTQGWLVTGRGGPSGLQAGLSDPPELASDLAARFGEEALFGPRRPSGSTLGEIRAGLIRSIDAQSEAVEWAVRREPFDLVFTVWDQTDTAAHLYWHWRDDPCPDASSPMAEVYRAVDRGIGRVLEAAGGDPLVVVCSDHGAYPISLRVRTPGWLQEKGLLEIGGGVENRAIASAGSLWLKTPRAIRALVPKQTRRRVGRIHEESFRQQTLISWDRARVYPQPISSEAFYLNLLGREPNGIVTDERSEETLSILEHALVTSRSPGGRPIATGSVRRSEAFWGPRAADAPDLIAHAGRGVYFSPTAVGEIFSVPERPDMQGGLPESLGYHDPSGLLILAGPRVKQGVSFTERSVTDVTPTILRYLDVAQPDDLDGSAVADAFVELAEARTSGGGAGDSRSSGELLTAEQEADIERQLRDLGYLE